jgi:Domain of Unknown Function (DUF1080)
MIKAASPTCSRFRTCFLLLFFWMAGHAVLAQQADERGWEPLFNGKDLTGWDIKIAGHALNDNYKNTFRVEDGMIRISYDEYQRFDDKYGHMYYHKPYSHYKLRFEYRFTGNQTPGGANWNVRNSGIMYHSQSARSLNMNQEFPVSLEVQLLGGLGKGPRTTGNLCTPGTIVHVDGKLNPDHCINSRSKTYEGDQWVRAEIVVLGDSVIHHLIEGDTVFTFQKPRIGEVYWAEGKKDAYSADWLPKNGMALKEGYIALQAESHPIDFRNIRILDLKGQPGLAARPAQPLTLVKALEQGHSHNDYWRPRPLTDALQRGFKSVEADVFLSNGALLVGHSRQELQADKTLESLYLAPLQELARREKKLYQIKSELYLYIDFKTEGPATYAALVPVLKKYESLLVKPGKKRKPGQVKVILTGNYPADLVQADKGRLVFLDGKVPDLAQGLDANLYPVVSGNWSSFFKWQGQGPMPAAEARMLETWNQQALKNGQQIRFWNVSEKNEQQVKAIWRVLLNYKSFLVGADHLDWLKEVIEERK